MRNLFFLLFSVVVCVPGSVLAETPIHQCKDADGGVVYSQLPCKDEEPAEPREPPEADEPESPEPVAMQAETLPVSTAPKQPVSDESREACKKRYRDEIDAIDAEIRREYAPEKDSEYKQRLLALTRKLRAC